MARESQLNSYMKQVRRRPILTAEQERELALRYRETGDGRARDRLIESSLAFVVKMAHKMARGRRATVEDLVQEGNLGLLRALDKYDPDKGFRFLTYARHWIEAFMRLALVRNHSMVKYGTTGLQNRMYFVWEARKRKQLKGERNELLEHDYQELADTFHTSPDTLKDIAHRLAAHDMSVDAPLGAESDRSLMNMLEAETFSLEEYVNGVQEREQVRDRVMQTAADSFTRQELVVLDRRVYTDDPETLREIGEDLGVSRERVRQIEGSILRKLREPIAALDFAPQAAA